MFASVATVHSLIKDVVLDIILRLTGDKRLLIKGASSVRRPRINGCCSSLNVPVVFPAIAEGRMIILAVVIYALSNCH